MPFRAMAPADTVCSPCSNRTFIFLAPAKVSHHARTEGMP